MKFKQNEIVTQAFDAKGKRLKRRFFTPGYTSYTIAMQLETFNGPCFFHADIARGEVFDITLILGHECCGKRFHIVDVQTLAYACNKCLKPVSGDRPEKVYFYHWNLGPLKADLEFNEECLSKFEDWFTTPDGLEALWLANVLARELEDLRQLVAERVLA